MQKISSDTLSISPGATLVLFGHVPQTDNAPLIAALAADIAARGFRVEAERSFAEWMLRCSGAALAAVDAPTPGTGAVVCLGGDGTFLRAAQWAAAAPVPLLGVNTGHLGYLAAYSLAETPDLVDTLASGSFTAERRLRLHTSARGLDRDFSPLALNEVAILKDESSAMLDIRVEADGHFLADYRADGLIISTPTGSTAYSLAAGGPIVQPTLDSILLTPIAPHTLTLRPLLLRADTTLRVVVGSRSPRFRLSLDGRSCSLPCGTEVNVTRGRHPVVVLRRTDRDFAATLRTKLLWGRR